MDAVERARIQLEIDSLPSGGITYKKISGKRYAYYQWREGGKQRARRVQDSEIDQLSELIEERKRLQGLLESDKATASVDVGMGASVFATAVRTGEQLSRFVAPVARWKKRECFTRLRDYVYGDSSDRVFVLYGLRRTGKTTLVRQLIGEMDSGMMARTAFMQVVSGGSLSDVNADLLKLERLGYRYVFIDEVTLLDDFIEGAALFSDVFAASGMKIVLSGTDSLGFVFSEDEQLYDRCIMQHTTFVPYREFEEVLGISGIDEFIQYGGTMSMGGADYNAHGTFSDIRRANEYVDSAIAHNIQHSLKNYQHGGHFRNLRALYDRDELTSAINRVVEDINHEFTVEVLTRDFKSHDLGISASNLRGDRFEPTDILDRIDVDEVTRRLKERLDILNRDERMVDIDDASRFEIREYLSLLDLTVDIDLVSLVSSHRGGVITVISQPGLRYAQANALIESLSNDATFAGVPIGERMRVSERIRSEIRGRMMEEIVLLETKKARPGCEVFKLQFDVGEIDMVVFDPHAATCELYEIKHSAERVEQQRRHLVNEAKCAAIRLRYGDILGRYVVYRGEDAVDAGVRYLNVEEYLKGLGANF